MRNRVPCDAFVFVQQSDSLLPSPMCMKELEDITNLGLTLRMRKELQICIKLTDRVRWLCAV